MKIKFHGAVDGVTGSCYELWDEALAVRILVDCGMFQGEPTREMRNAGPLPYVPRDLTHVLLMHAHLDHVGMLPRLYNEGYEGSVYTLNETAELAKAVLGDAARLGAPYQERDIERIKWHEPATRLQDVGRRHRCGRVARRGLLKGWRCITKQAPKGEVLKGPAIIIAGSGMCDAGPVQQHLKDHLRDPSATVLFTGYCGASSLGGRLLSYGELPPTERKRDRRPIDVGGDQFEARHITATIARLTGYSAHADQAGLLDWMWSGKPGEPKRCIGGTVIITHGELDQRRLLAEAIKARGAAAGEAVVVGIPDKAGMGYQL